MATDQVITSRDVLDAVMRVRRVGIDPLLQELEQQEPDLAEIVLEETTALYQRFKDSGVSGKEARRRMHRIESLILVVVAACRQGHRRLWEWEEEGTQSVPPAGQLTGQLPPGLTCGLNVQVPPAESGPEPLFRVVYVIDINALDARRAAEAAHTIMSDASSMAPVLHVLSHAGQVTVVDLSGRHDAPP